MALVAAVLVALQLVIRGMLACGGYFYWDDLILVSRAGTHGLLSPSYLFDDHDGHVMPARLVSQHAQQMKRIGLIRLDRQDLPADLFGILQAPGLMMLNG